jgi:hypothetical protein
MIELEERYRRIVCVLHVLVGAVGWTFVRWDGIVIGVIFGKVDSDSHVL